ncbi:hypothetical protein D3C71_1781220 [compost metagenome]
MFITRLFIGTQKTIHGFAFNHKKIEINFPYPRHYDLGVLLSLSLYLIKRKTEINQSSSYFSQKRLTIIII